MNEVSFKKEIFCRRLVLISIGFIWIASIFILGLDILGSIAAMVIWDVLWYFITPTLVQINRKKKQDRIPKPL